MSATPTYFVQPVYIGGPHDGHRGVVTTPDRLRRFIDFGVRGAYRLDGCRAGGREAVYRWEAAK